MTGVPHARAVPGPGPFRTPRGGTLLAVMDRYLRYVRWTASAERLTGLPARDVVGRSLYEVFPDAAGSGAESQYFEALRTSEPATIPTRLDGVDRRITVRPEGGQLGVYLQAAAAANRRAGA